MHPASLLTPSGSRRGAELPHPDADSAHVVVALLAAHAEQRLADLFRKDHR